MPVERPELATTPYRDGAPIGAAGAYEELKGLAHVALDPNHPADLLVTDLALAARGADGLVRFDADVSILRPADPARRNRRLLLDVVNRGHPMLRSLGEDWLLGQGFTVVRCGWQHDLKRGPGLGLSLVETAIDGRPITGRMARMFEPDAPATSFPLGEPGVRPYRADPAHAAGATLSERAYLGGPARILPRDSWRFARPDAEGQGWTEDFTSVLHEPGFKPGFAYELLFVASGAPLTGHGLAATRDLVSHLRFGASGANPMAGEIDHVLAYGASQSGRFLRQMLYDGFCEDREGRLLFDGLLIHTGGARLLETNWRFGQPVYNGWDAATAIFPFTDAVQTDAVTGITDGLLARALASGKLPKIVHTNTAAEYWGGQVGGLAHVSADGRRDAEVPDHARIYYLAGTQHGVAALEAPSAGRSAYPANTIDYGPLLRAAFANLDRWACEDVTPPPSRYGRLDEATLVERGVAAAALALLPGPGAPSRLAVLHRLDFGPTARRTRRLEQVPPALGEPLTLHVSQVDADGNEIAGVRHPEIAVPLATYTGWNPRHPRIGGADQNLRTAGATIRFATTPQAREAADPRPSIAERHPSRDHYQQAVRAAAEQLVAEGYMLAVDVQAVVAQAGRRYDLYTAA